MVDSGNALVVAELKVVEDDDMLMQGVDYYDYIAKNLESLSRVYKDFNIDPMQEPRLFLIAPSFSIVLIERCKWIDIPISLFIHQCIELEDRKNEIIPIFKEIPLPSLPEKIEVYSLEDRLNYITDPSFRKLATNLLDEIKSWDKKVSIEPTKYDISLKVSGRVFAYLYPRRKHFIIGTYNMEGKWTGYSIEQLTDLDKAKTVVKINFDKFM